MAIENNQYEILGAHLGGVHEALWTTKEGSKRTSRSLKYVVSPHDRGGSILAGGAAERSRVGLGLPWPPEAQIVTGESIGRVPVPILWRGLTQDRNGRSEWTVGQIRTRYVDLLAAHIVSALEGYSLQQELILTIPDTFSEFSQQRLLDSLARFGRHKVRLLWNPIALALAWLDSLRRNFNLRSDKESLLVINVGAGSIDCNTFRLQYVEVNGEKFVVPVRSGARTTTTLDGFDLAVGRVVRALQETKNSDDVHALWFCLGLLDAWNPPGSKTYSTDKIWNRNGAWEKLPKGFFDNTLTPTIETGSTEQIESLLGVSEGTSRILPSSEEWGDLITQLIEVELARSNSSLRGVIVSGFPFGFLDSEWIDLVQDACSAVEMSVCVEKPEADAIWNVGDGAESIALGAGIFGGRLANGLPTYLDTLPEFEVLRRADTPEGREFKSIMRSRVVSGGEIYRDVIKRRYALPKGQIELDAYLRLHDAENTSIRKTSFRFPRPPDRQMPLDLHVEIQAAGGLAKVEIVPEDIEFLGGVQIYLDYEDMEQIEQLPEEELGWPPTRPPHLPLTDGLTSAGYRRLMDAIHQFFESSFNEGDYSDRLSDVKRRMQTVIGTYDPDTRTWSRYRLVDVNGQAETLTHQRIASKLSERIETDFLSASSEYNNIRHSRRRDRSVASHEMERMQKDLIIVGSYLFGAAPNSIRSFFDEEYKKNPKIAHKWIYPAGRISQNSQEYFNFFQAMVASAEGREDKPRYFTIGWLYAAKQILSSREDAALSLTHEFSIDILEGLIIDLQSWIEYQGVNGFGATLQLLFYMLRYRRKDRGFLSQTRGAEEAELRTDFIKAIDSAYKEIEDQELFLTHGRKRTALEVLAGLKEFIDYRGSMNIIEKLAELDDEESGE